MEKLNQTFKIDESLDSAIVVEPLSTRKAQYPRFKQATITVTDGATPYVWNWLTFGDSVQVVTTGATQRYEHTISLIEPTKWLEKIPCGSLTFTQPLDETQKTLYDVVWRLMTLCPFVRYSKVTTTRVFTIPIALENELRAIKAPQFYFDKKNLREALIDVFKYINAIPRLTIVDGAFVLTVDKINDRKNLIPFTVQGSKIIDLKAEISGENYATKVESFQENVIPSDDITTPNAYGASITDMISFRADEIIIGETTLKLFLNSKADRVLSAKIKITTEVDSPVLTVDLAPYMFEKQVYDTLETSGGVGTKNYAFYWQRGSNVLDGFSYVNAPIIEYSALENILLNISSNNAWFEVVFLVEYIPFIETIHSEQYREDLTTSTMESTIQINPNERINNAYKTTSNMYGQIQRLGVDTFAFSKLHKHLSAYVPSTNDDGIYSLGDYTSDGYIITTVELVFYNHFVIARYELSLNFNRIAQFMNIDKEFRPYEISLTKSDYTLKRDIMIPMFIVEVGSAANANHVSNGFVSPFMKTFGSSAVVEQITCATLVESGFTEGVLMPVITMAEKNTIKFKLDFKDTKHAGDRAVNAEGITTSLLKKQVPYTKSNGTMDMAEIELYHSYWDFRTDAIAGDLKAMNVAAKYLPYVDTSKNIVTYGTFSDTKYVLIYPNYASFPVDGSGGTYYLALDTWKIYEWTTVYAEWGYASATKNTSIYALPDYYVVKDRSEILGFEMTLPIIPDKDQVNVFVIGDMLSQDNVLIKERAAKTLYIYTSTTPFSKANTKNVGTATVSAHSPTVATNQLIIPEAITLNYDYYAIGDEDGNLYLAVNQKNLAGTKTVVGIIYFNFLEEREM
jgi:hypothetical protein